MKPLNFMNFILNAGTSSDDDLNKTRLIRQLNGLNLFFALVALTIGLLSFFLFTNSYSGKYMVIMQVIATVFYISNIFLMKYRKMGLVRVLTINVFEWQLFVGILLTNGWGSPLYLIVVLYPLMAALVEASIIKHLIVALVQVLILLVIRFAFPSLDKFIASISVLTPATLDFARIMSYVYIPVMAAVIISLIYRENIFAREKQKEFLNQLTMANKKLESYAEELKDETRRLKTEIEVGRKLQTILLPSEKEISGIKELDISGFMRTADEVGGDYYDIFKLQDKVVIAIGDVTGHGLTSGIIMLMAQTVIRSLVEINMDADQVLKVLNSVLYSNIVRINEDRNMTLSLLFYEKGKFSIAGQHESIVICRSSGKIEIIETINLGIYIGFMPDITEYLKTMEIKLEKGDVMLLYTDGLTEAVNDRNEQYGLNNLSNNLKSHRQMNAKQINYQIITEVYNFIGESRIYDDITLIVIKQL